MADPGLHQQSSINMEHFTYAAIGLGANPPGLQACPFSASNARPSPSSLTAYFSHGIQNSISRTNKSQDFFSWSTVIGPIPPTATAASLATVTPSSIANLRKGRCRMINSMFLLGFVSPGVFARVKKVDSSEAPLNFGPATRLLSRHTSLP